MKKCALIVSLAYKPIPGKPNPCAAEVYNGRTLNDIEHISSILDYWEFPKENIRVLKEEEATRSNFLKEVSNLGKNKKDINFIYFVGHGYRFLKKASKNPSESNKDSKVSMPDQHEGFCLWDTRMEDDEFYKLLDSEFPQGVKNIIMMAQCFSGGAADLKFDGIGKERIKNHADRLKSKTVFISAAQDDEIATVDSRGTPFAYYSKKIILENKSLTFNDFITLLSKFFENEKNIHYSPEIFSSFKLNDDDLFFSNKKRFLKF